MKPKIIGALALAMALAVAAAGQGQDEYLEVFTARVKPEKRAAFDAIIKKMVDANRRHKGDTWITGDVTYGEHNTVLFISFRRNYAALEPAFNAFMGALGKAYGPGAAKIFQDFNDCVVSSRSEVRRRRWDLSRNAPSDPAAAARMAGEARWVRTTITRLRPGRLGDYTAQLQAYKAAAEKATPMFTAFVTQSASGQQGTVFYSTTVHKSLAELDRTGTPLQQLLGEQGFQRYVRTLQESVLSTETLIYRFVPELSNPPEEVAAVAPDFWRPKPPAAKPAKAAKAKPAEAGTPR